MKSFLNTRVGRRFLGMFIAISLPLMAAGWFAIKSATSALQRQTGLILRVASNGAEAQLREFLLHLKEETLALSADQRMREALEMGSRIDSRNVSELELPRLMQQPFSRKCEQFPKKQFFDRVTTEQN